MTSKAVLGYCTFPDAETAQRICAELVKDNTIACANVLGPMTSFYKWEGQSHKEQEWVAILKTADSKRATLMEKIRATHPYENPCLIFLAIEDGLPDFLKWLCSPAP